MPTWIAKRERKRSHRSVSLRNKEAEILNKILAYRIQIYIKKTCYEEVRGVYFKKNDSILENLSMQVLYKSSKRKQSQDNWVAQWLRPEPLVFSL